MKRMILSLTLSAALAAGASMALQAQGHGPGHWGGPAAEGHDPSGFLAKALDLTAEQKAAVQKLHDDLRTKSEPLLEQGRQQHEELEALLAGASPDPAEVGQKAIAAHATHEQLEALHDDFKARLAALLTPDQLAKLKQLQEMHRDHHGFGPPPVPGS